MAIFQLQKDVDSLADEELATTLKKVNQTTEH